MDNPEPPKIVEKKIASPCISVCALDENDVCSGCFRDLEEIARWSSMNNEQKRVVLLLCRDRRQQRFGDFGLGG